MKKCSQDNCTETPNYRYTWPGKDEAYICEKHRLALVQVAAALGVYVQTIPLSTDET